MEDPNKNAPLTKIKNDMTEAVLQDNMNNTNMKPATAKLNHLDEFIRALLNKKLQLDLLDENILEVVKKWLEPLPDKSLPNIKIRKGLLQALRLVKISKCHLLESGVGKIIHFYMKNPRECKEVRDLAKEVVNIWVTRVIAEEEE